MNLQDESAYQYWFDVITPQQKVMCRLSLSFTWILKEKQAKGKWYSFVHTSSRSS